MINEYLIQKKKEEETTSNEALDALKGEKIFEIIPVDSDKYMFLMNSGGSVIIHTAGAFTIYNREKTQEILNEILAHNELYSKSHARAKISLESFKQNAKQSNEAEVTEQDGSV